MSLIREPDVYEKYERVIIQHTVREVAELAYRDFISQDLPNHEFLGEMVAPSCSIPERDARALPGAAALRRADRERAAGDQISGWKAFRPSMTG
jgi:ferredoxin-NADP reductase